MTRANRTTRTRRARAERTASGLGVLRVYVRTESRGRGRRRPEQSDGRGSRRRGPPELLTLVVAADELRRRFGDRFDDDYGSGKRLLRRALGERRGSPELARALCDALERAGMLTFRRERRRCEWTIDPFAW